MNLPSRSTVSYRLANDKNWKFIVDIFEHALTQLIYGEFQYR